MDAAERVFADAHPDDVGLKDIARAAGTSHALITHYFGTYAGLVEATLERRLRLMRTKVLIRLADASALDRPEEVLAMLFDALEDPVHLRLFRWLVGGERQTSTQLFQDRGLTAVANQVARALCPTTTPEPELVEKIEVALITAVSAAYGYALSKRGLAMSVGRQPSRKLDAEVQRTLAAMLRAYL
jgi:TetR/AcrR family transcriptional regulator, repressor for neighboring sulfatase